MRIICCCQLVEIVRVINTGTIGVSLIGNLFLLTLFTQVIEGRSTLSQE